MTQNQKSNPWEVPIETLQGYIDRCKGMLKKELFADVRARTEQSLKTLEAVMQSRLDEQELLPPEHLKGPALEIEKEWIEKENSGFSGIVHVQERQGEFFATLNFGDHSETVRESTLVRRITSKLSNIENGKKHKLKLYDQILTGKGFDTLTEYVQALRFIKYTKCNVHQIPFTELNVKDVYVFTKASKAKIYYLEEAIKRAVSLLPA